MVLNYEIYVVYGSCVKMYVMCAVVYGILVHHKIFLTLYSLLTFMLVFHTCIEGVSVKQSFFFAIPVI